MILQKERKINKPLGIYIVYYIIVYHIIPRLKKPDKTTQRYRIEIMIL